jgi:hypothetical protein
VSWSRRHVLHAGLAGAGWFTLGSVPVSARFDDDAEVAADLAGKTLNLVLRYRTDPDRIARVLPPALEPDEAAEVAIDWWLHYPDRGGENLFYPGPYTESGIHVTARWQGQRGMFQIGMPLDQDWGRVAGRENVGLVKKDGTPRLSRQGRRVRADLTRRGKLLYRVETEVLDAPAHPMLWHRETGFGAFLYRYRLDPDWRRGPLGPDPVELWLRVLGGKRGVYPQEMVEGAPRECDLDRTRFAMVEPSPLDPFAEFPLLALLGVSYRETALYPQADRAHREAKTPTRIERLQYIDPKRFEPWAFYLYDRPITASRAWVPVAWPKERTAFKLEPDEIARYRSRDALELHVRDVIQVNLEIAPELHAQLLPPGLEPGGQPRVGSWRSTFRPAMSLHSRFENSGCSRSAGVKDEQPGTRCRTWSGPTVTSSSVVRPSVTPRAWRRSSGRASEPRSPWPLRGWDGASRRSPTHRRTPIGHRWPL